MDEIAHVNAERDDWQQRCDRIKDMNHSMSDKIVEFEKDINALQEERDRLLKELKTSQLEAKELAAAQLLAKRCIYMHMHIYIYIYIYLFSSILPIYFIPIHVQ